MTLNVRAGWRIDPNCGADVFSVIYVYFAVRCGKIRADFTNFGVILILQLLIQT
jgi:hypothetical protein